MGKLYGVSPAPRRVLVIDDHQDSLEMLVELLRLEGHDAHGASDGPRALELAGSLAPHVILCDLSLPQMDGYEIARRLRARPQSSAMRLIAFTGHNDPASIERAREAGFDDLVAKPIDPERLKAVIEGPPAER